jgi:hypothetical protein
MKDTPQARYSKRRLASQHTIRLDVVFDVSKPADAEAVQAFDAMKARFGGPKPALLALLRGRDT